VTVNINGVGYISEIKDGVATITAYGLKNGTYVGTVTYLGNKKYDPSNCTVDVVVQAPITIEVNGTGNSSQVVINLPGNGTVQAFIDGEEVPVDVDGNGTAKVNLTGLEPGEHNLTVIYTDADGTQSVVEQKIIVPRWDSSVNASAKTIREGDPAVIVVTVGNENMTGDVKVYINGTGYYATVEDGVATITAYGLKNGTYVGTVTYLGNEKYDPSNCTVDVVVQAPITIEINGSGNSSQVVINLPGNGTVQAFIDGEEVPVDVDGNGTAKVNLTGLEPGEHNLTVIYTDADGTQSVVEQKIIVPRWDSSVNATAKTIREGDPAIIVVTVGSENMTGNVTVNINGVGYISEIKDGVATITAYGLKNGTYVGTVTYLGNEKYDPSDCTVEVVVQAPITVEVNGTGNSSQVVIDLPGEGTVEVFIDGINKTDEVTIEDGVAKVNLTGLEPGEHNLTIIYTDEDGTQSIVEQKIIVPRWDSTVNATAKTIREGDDAKVVVKVGSAEMTGRVFVDINGTGYYATVEDGEVTIVVPGLKAGTYVANVTYEGNMKYDPSNNTFTIVVEEPIVIDINGSGNSSQVVIDLPKNGTDNVTVLIDGNEVPVSKDNHTATANLTGLEPGEHNITVIYTDADGTQSVVNTTITVPKWSSEVSASAKTIREGDSANVVVQVGAAEMSGRVLVDIGGTGYYADIDNGEITIVVPGLKAGTYEANVTYEGNGKYDPSNNTFTVVVEEPIVINVNGSGNSSQVVIDLPKNGTDNVTVLIDGNEVPVSKDNHTATANLTGLEPGEHNITVIYTDADGTQSIVNTTIDVPRWSSEVSASAKTIREGDSANVVVQVGAAEMSGRVLVDIGGTGYYADIDNGEVTIVVPGLKAGTYVANVTYEGNAKYDPSNNTFTVVVEEPIVINVNGSGNSSQVVIDLPKNGTDNVTVLIDGNEVPVSKDNHTATANLTGLEPGEHNITVIYTDADGTQSVVNTTIDVPRWSSEVSASAPTIREGDNENVVVKVGSADMTGRVLVDINGTGYYADIIKGEVTIVVPGLKAGTYEANVTYEGNGKYDPSNNTFTVVVQSPIIIDVDGAGNSTKVIVTLPEDSSNNVTVLVDGKEIPVSIENGTAVADLNNITAGEHNVTVIYTDNNGTKSIANKTIVVYVSIKANNMTRGWNSPFDYEAEFLDKDGHVIANTTMEFKVNGQTYSVMTDNKGIAKLNESHLAIGTYEVEITNTVTHEVAKHNVTIVERLIENKDITMDFVDGTYYVVRAIGDDGQPVGKGEVVGITVNKRGYVAITDANGYARLKIDLNPKTYTIVAEYSKYRVSNKLVVKQTLKLVKKTVKVKKTAKKLVLKAKLKWTNGKAIKGKKITFKFKGKKYKAKTNKKGIAKVKVKKKVIKKLKKGKKYKYSAKYLTNVVKGKVKVKK
jgi:C4-type Zn-finger protein